MKPRQKIVKRTEPHFAPCNVSKGYALLTRAAVSHAATHMKLHKGCSRATCRRAGKCLGTDINRDTRYCHGDFNDDARELLMTLLDFENDIPLNWDLLDPKPDYVIAAEDEMKKRRPTPSAPARPSGRSRW